VDSFDFNWVIAIWSSFGDHRQWSLAEINSLAVSLSGFMMKKTAIRYFLNKSEAFRFIQLHMNTFIILILVV